MINSPIHIYTTLVTNNNKNMITDIINGNKSIKEVISTTSNTEDKLALPWKD
jgi:formiminotetrahydrofolate cyclodeaminase